MIVHSATNLRSASVRLITAIAAIFGLRIWSQDISQAYLQFTEELLRDVYVRPTKEFKLDEGQLLKLIKPLYGLSESGDHWFSTMSSHLMHDLDMQRTAVDVSLFFKRLHNRLSGLCGVCVDDTINAGDDDFVEDCDATQEHFNSHKRVFDRFKFAGTEICTVEEGIFLHQST